jgi:hypothetical protein
MPWPVGSFKALEAIPVMSYAQASHPTTITLLAPVLRIVVTND